MIDIAILDRAELANAIAYFKDVQESLDNLLMTNGVSAFELAKFFPIPEQPSPTLINPLAVVAMNNIILTDAFTDGDTEEDEEEVTYLDGLVYATAVYQKANAALIAALGTGGYNVLLVEKGLQPTRNDDIVNLLSHQTWVAGSTVPAHIRARALNHLNALIAGSETVQKQR